MAFLMQYYDEIYTTQEYYVLTSIHYHVLTNKNLMRCICVVQIWNKYSFFLLILSWYQQQKMVHTLSNPNLLIISSISNDRIGRKRWFYNNLFYHFSFFLLLLFFYLSCSNCCFYMFTNMLTRGLFFLELLFS